MKRILIGLILILASVTTIAAPSEALGFNSWNCAVINSAIWSAQSVGPLQNDARTARGSCGQTANARARYEIYPGSPLYYAGWTMNSSLAISKPGNVVVGGEHKITGGQFLGTWGPFRT